MISWGMLSSSELCECHRTSTSSHVVDHQCSASTMVHIIRGGIRGVPAYPLSPLSLSVAGVTYLRL